MYTVKVSARLLNFPSTCCCCGSVGAKERYRASSTRRTGKRVVKTDTRAWDFPICDNCLNWISCERSARTYGIFVIAFLLLGLCSITLGLVDIKESIRVILLITGMGLLVLSSLLFIFWRRERAEADNVKPDPSCTTVPVVYVGWNGSVHTFLFSNTIFCDLFERANAKKIVG